MGLARPRAAGGLPLATMLLPPPLVAYVLVHELTQLSIPNPGPAFWRTVDLALPEYELPEP